AVPPRRASRVHASSRPPADGIHERAARRSAAGARRGARGVQPGPARVTMRTVFTSRVFSVEVGAKRFPNGREHEVAIVRHPPADSPRKADEDEDITAKSVTIAEARAMVARGEIVDLKTAYALTLI